MNAPKPTNDPVAVVEPTAKDPLALTIVERSNEELDQIFEDRAWDYFQMSGNEFLERYESGELSDFGHPLQARAFGLYILRPVDR